MSNCCASSAKPPYASTFDAFGLNGPKAICPECGKTGKGVEEITVKHLLKEEKISQLGEASHLFCENPKCDVVYFSTQPGPVFHKNDLRVRVGLKETEAPIPVCYCFGYTERMIFEEIKTMGTTTIPDRIRDEVRAGNCQCVVENPRGLCCLGDIGRTVKKGMARNPFSGAGE